jgi:hypoxanthine phosphoribosyltransferase
VKLSDTPLLTAARIRERIVELGRDISTRYAGREIVLVVVLKGACVFAADLMRQLSVEANLQFIRARSYSGTESRGQVDITLMPEIGVADRDVIVVEDILDTGRTTSAIMERLRGEGAMSVALCTLLDKPSRRVVPVRAEFTGFQIDDLFVVGYGLDCDERYRCLPDVRVLLEE